MSLVRLPYFDTVLVRRVLVSWRGRDALKTLDQILCCRGGGLLNFPGTSAQVGREEGTSGGGGRKGTCVQEQAAHNIPNEDTPQLLADLSIFGAVYSDKDDNKRVLSKE